MFEDSEIKKLWGQYLDWIKVVYGPGASFAFTATHLADVLGITRGAVTYHMQKTRDTIQDMKSDAGLTYRVYTDGLFRGWQFAIGGKMWTADPMTFFRTVLEYWQRDRRMVDSTCGPLFRYAMHGEVAMPDFGEE